ncbi:TonB-dependent receptor [Novosphingobium terrae]|uniref:TonB-dependent receptor n=1 Tax=Novosphingobium terrae TaxID=2726189 RepID=UPI0019807C1F|nr:TonB-dependent siderophore receptor [Novosphingobium terrae]
MSKDFSLAPPANVTRTLAMTLGLSLAPVVTSPAVAADATDNAPHPEIIVTGQSADTHLAFNKIATSLLDTPQAVTVISHDELDKRAVNSLADALRLVPGLSLGAGETSWQGNNASLRGFTTRDDTFLDGMRDFGYYDRDTFNDESIEVLKGPAGILFGRGSTGGVIHQVSKQPGLTPIYDANIAGGTDNTVRGTIDINRPLSETAAIRINAMGQTGNVADRNEALNRRWGMAPTISLGLGTDTRFTLSYLHQEEHNRPDYGIPWFNGAPAKVDRRNYYGFADDYLDTTVNVVTARLDHDFSASTTLHSQIRYSHDTREFRTSEAVVPTTYAPTTPLSAITVTRNEFSGTSVDQFAQGVVDLTNHFATGRIRHTLTTGVELGLEMPRPVYIFHNGVITTNLANPQPQVFTEASSYVRLNARTRAATTGLYAIDTMELGSHWIAIAGLRWDRYEAHYQSTGYDATGTTVAHTDIDPVNHKLSKRAALTYKPVTNGSFYVSYADSFDPSAEGITSQISSGRTVAQANLNVAPETGRIIEVGSKWSLAGGRLLWTTALFDILKNNVRVPDPTNSAFNTNGGRQRARGFDTELVGNITRAWTLRAGYSYLYTETLWTDNPTAAGSPRIGAPLPLSPRSSGSLETDYALTPRFIVGGGAMYQSSRLGQNTNASFLVAPGYVTFEARAHYDVTKNLSLQANLYNATNKLYYDQLHPFHVIPGAGRSALFTVSWKQ